MTSTRVRRYVAAACHSFCASRGAALLEKSDKQLRSMFLSFMARLIERDFNLPHLAPDYDNLVAVLEGVLEVPPKVYVTYPSIKEGLISKVLKATQTQP